MFSKFDPLIYVCKDIDQTKVTTETTTKFESTKPGTTATPRPTIPGPADTGNLLEAIMIPFQVQFEFT